MEPVLRVVVAIAMATMLATMVMLAAVLKILMVRMVATTVLPLPKKVAATRRCWHYLIVMNASFDSIDGRGD